MIRLRWLYRTRRITAQMVKEYADEHELSLSQAKSELNWPPIPPVLQQWDETDHRWLDIPIEHEYVEVE